MTHRCPPEDEICVILDLAPDDPVRIACDECVRCHTLLREARAFLSGDASIDVARRDTVDRVLASALDEAMAVGHGVTAARRARPLRRRTLGWALFAAASVAAIAVLHGSPDPVADPSGVLRRDAGDAATANVILESRRDEDGDVILSWPSWPESALYRVEFFSPTLDTLLIVDLRDPSFRIRPQSLQGLAPDHPFLVRVHVMRQGTTVATSGLREILPR